MDNEDEYLKNFILICLFFLLGFISGYIFAIEFVAK
jgi:uncharacterized membrane protein YqaE (UPF0057 family)